MSKPRVRYVAKKKPIEEIEQVSEIESSKDNLNQEIESILKELIENKLNLSIDTSQQTQEEKSDNETLILDEESIDIPTLFEVELVTKEGIKKIEFKQCDDPSEVAGRIATQYELNKGLEAAIEYKLRKIMNDLLI